MRIVRSLLILVPIVLGVSPLAEARTPTLSPPKVGLFVSADVPKAVSFEVQRMLRSHGIAFKAVRLRVKTDRTAVFSRETRGPLARRVSAWLGGLPIETFDWDSQYEAVVYLARDFAPRRFRPTTPRPIVQKARARSPKPAGKPKRVLLGMLVSRMGHLGTDAPAAWARESRVVRVEPAPDVLAWNDLLNRVEKLESQIHPELGQAVLLIGSPLEQTLGTNLVRVGWVKLQGQPVDVNGEGPIADLANATGPAEADRPVSLDLRRRIQFSVFGSILSPFNKTGQVFGQLLGPTAEIGFIWREPWVVQASLGLFSGSANVSRSDGQTSSSDLTLIPFGILLIYPLGGTDRAQPFIGVGPALEYQALSNRGIFEPAGNGGDSAIGFGYELKGGARFGVSRKIKLVTEVSWQAAQATIAGSREGSAARFSLGIGY